MNLDMTDWAYGFGGGLMIGAAAALFLLVNGRIAGVSGVLGALTAARPPEDAWERIAFILGMIGAPAIWLAMGGTAEANAPKNPAILVAAGLLVGVGTRLGGGCTSGHGVCGMTRLSGRSLVAVPVFILVGVAVVTLGRQVIGGL